MALTLTMLRCPDAVPPQTREIGGGEFRIGRGPDNDWVLPDPDRHLSKRHCVLAYRAGRWQLADTSSNGTFLNREAEPLGPDAPRDLRDGDRVRLGAYEIEVRIAEENAAAQDFGAGRPMARSGADDPFGDDPFGAPATSGTPNPFAEPAGSAFGSSFGATPVSLPPDFDPFADEPGLSAGAPTQPDHAPSFADAFQPPRPAAPVLPDDWDLNVPPPPPPAPSVAPLASEPAPEPPPQAPMRAAAASMDEPGQSGQPGLVAAFLRGADMADVEIAEPEAKMQALGAAFRALVAGLRQVLIARATIKTEFRIEQTMIRARGNNPLKFSTGDDDALAALLGTGRRADMSPSEAVADALRDIRLHELASVSAMQSAVRALLARLDPAALRSAADQGGISLPGQRKARAWDEFEKLHAGITQALSDDFDSAFGKAFARAYEKALDEVAAQEKTP